MYYTVSEIIICDTFTYIFDCRSTSTLDNSIGNRSGQHRSQSKSRLPLFPISSSKKSLIWILQGAIFSGNIVNLRILFLTFDSRNMLFFCYYSIVQKYHLHHGTAPYITLISAVFLRLCVKLSLSKPYPYHQIEQCQSARRVPYQLFVNQFSS